MGLPTLLRWSSWVHCGLLAYLAGWLTLSAESRAAPADPPPNIVILLADDLGYGDLSCYGHPTIRTPNLDRMAAEGRRFTQFYVAAPVCTPTRAALLTGRLPIRSGMSSDQTAVLFPASLGGLPDDELTLAQALKSRGYATACIGKWHLGHLPQYRPTRRGFDYYFGLPYSNDMGAGARGEPPVPLVRNEAIIEQPVDQRTLTARYTAEAIGFIREHRDQPFLLYLPFTFPHVPLYASDAFRGRSARGLYGDVVEELDWGVGQLLETLRELGLADRTLVVFTSDNGPWLSQSENGGSAGLLRDGKGSTWEGGMRVPAIAWWPGRIEPGVSLEVASVLDLFPTALELAGVPLATDRVLDGTSLAPVLFGNGQRAARAFFYYRGKQLMAARRGPWKAHFVTQPGLGPGAAERHDPPLLFHLERDPSERFDLRQEHPQVIAEIGAEVKRHLASLRPVPSQLDVWAWKSAVEHRLYVHVLEWPASGELLLPGVRGVRSARLLSGPGEMLEVRAETVKGTVLAVPADPPAKAASVMVIELAEAPPVNPLVFRPRPDGSVVLSVQHADWLGEAVEAHAARLQAHDGQAHVTSWTDKRAYLAWQIELQSGATYELELVYAAGAGSEGASCAVRIGPKSLAGRVVMTGGVEKFSTQSLGRVDIAAGRHAVEIRPAELPPAGALMNLRQIVLRPAP